VLGMENQKEEIRKKKTCSHGKPEVLEKEGENGKNLMGYIEKRGVIVKVRMLLEFLAG